MAWSTEGYFSFLSLICFPSSPLALLEVPDTPTPAVKDPVWGRKGPEQQRPGPGPQQTYNQQEVRQAHAKEQHEANKRDEGSPADNAREAPRRGLGLCYLSRLPGGGSSEGTKG